LVALGVRVVLVVHPFQDLRLVLEVQALICRVLQVVHRVQVVLEVRVVRVVPLGLVRQEQFVQVVQVGQVVPLSQLDQLGQVVRVVLEVQASFLRHQVLACQVVLEVPSVLVLLVGREVLVDSRSRSRRPLELHLVEHRVLELRHFRVRHQLLK
uniref:Secreted protein n=1 Tax=Anisakis simplex TaxID=6269 RepID=A0A0M3K914_ANISI